MTLTAHLFTEAGKEELLSAQVGGGPYITERDGEYYHLGAWRTEPVLPDGGLPVAGGDG